MSKKNKIDPKSLPKPKCPPTSFCTAVHEWTGNTLNCRSGFYAGRGPNRGDLNENHMEKIFNGISRDFSPQHAELFVDFVQNLTDLSASAFLVAFEYFFNTGCSDPKGYTQHRLDGVTPSANDNEGRLAEGMASIFSVMADDRSPEFTRAESEGIKWAFLRRHNVTPPKRCNTNGGYIFY